MARAGMSDEEMTAFLKETFCVDSTFTARAGKRVRASRLGARVCAVSKRRRGARAWQNFGEEGSGALRNEKLT